MSEPLKINAPGSARGHRFVWSEEVAGYVWEDSGAPIIFNGEYVERACAACGRMPSPEGHDACIADLPGVAFACCGHGRPFGNAPAYVKFDDGRELQREEAIAFFREQAREVPTNRGVFPVEPVE